ncbi:MAG TPA: Rieske (2Fe-2S) protein [Planctomycetota bacterium]|nr:Rieske (2Fe-2S) protein [Planctomycetota bacterium]
MTLVSLGSVDKVPNGQGFCFIVGVEEIAVFRQRDGKVFAVQNRCPHKQGPLSEGVLGAGVVICPFHGHKFDLSSGKGPDGEQLQVYPVREKEGQLLLALEPRP